jgi:hypothetical protein
MEERGFSKMSGKNECRGRGVGVRDRKNVAWRQKQRLEIENGGRKRGRE